MPTYLDDNGNPITASAAPQGKTYLDDNGDPIQADQPSQPQGDTSSFLGHVGEDLMGAGKWVGRQALEQGPQALGAAIGATIGSAAGPPGMLAGAGLGAGAVGLIERGLGTKPTSESTLGQIGQVAGDVAGGALQELGPAISKTTPVPSGQTLGRSAQKDLMASMKPIGNKPYFNESLQRAVPELNKASKAAGKPINTIRDAYDLVSEAKKSVWDEYTALMQANDAKAQEAIMQAKKIDLPKRTIENKLKLQSEPSVIRPMKEEFVDRTMDAQRSLNQAVDTLTIDGNQIADSMVSAIGPRLERQNPALAEKIRKTADTYRHRMDLREAEQFLQEGNHELAPIYARGPAATQAAKVDPNTAHLFKEVESIREQLYAKLDALPGDKNAAELKRRYGALEEVQKKLSKKVNSTDSAEPTNWAEQLSWAQAGGRAARDLATGHPIKATVNIAYPVAAKYARSANSPDALIQRAFADYNKEPAAGLPPNWLMRLIPILARTQGNAGQPEQP